MARAQRLGEPAQAAKWGNARARPRCFLVATPAATADFFHTRRAGSDDLDDGFGWLEEESFNRKKKRTKCSTLQSIGPTMEILPRPRLAALHGKRAMRDSKHPRRRLTSLTETANAYSSYRDWLPTIKKTLAALVVWRLSHASTTAPSTATGSAVIESPSVMGKNSKPEPHLGHQTKDWRARPGGDAERPAIADAQGATPTALARPHHSDPASCALPRIRWLLAQFHSVAA